MATQYTYSRNGGVMILPHPTQFCTMALPGIYVYDLTKLYYGFTLVYHDSR